jgi:hypothetical protein
MRHRSRLVFGIYPGGGAGSVNPTAAARPENAALRLGALERLRGSARRFVLHLYTDFTAGPSDGASLRAVARTIAQYARHRFQSELVIRYRPADRGASDNVAAYARFVREVVRQLAHQRSLVALQITNEANVTGAPDASDGDYPGAIDALIAGVRAGHRAARHHRARHLKIGFNFAVAGNRPGFWRALRHRGGRRFARAVDWVGMDLYPGTWSPPAFAQATPRAVKREITHQIRHTRRRLMPDARLGRLVALHISENGFPTGDGRSYAEQADLLHAAVHAVDRIARRYHVTGYRWFDLRDSDSAAPSFESHYGLLRSDYSPKPAFDVLRHLIGTLAGAPRR